MSPHHADLLPLNIDPDSSALKPLGAGQEVPMGLCLAIYISDG